LGGDADLGLADALQSGLLALTAPPPPVTAAALAAPASTLAYRRLNDRHRDHLIVTALGEGLGVAAAGTDRAALKAGGNVIWTTGIDRGALAFWQAEVDMLRAMKWHRTDRLSEIVVQTEDTLSFFGQVMPQLLTGHAHVLILLDAVHDLCFRLAAEMKDILRLPRPDVLAADVAPCIATPAHGAMPSGHGTEAFAAAAVLGILFPDRREDFRRVAGRIAMNRSFAGVHYPVDHHVGAILGDLIAGHAVDRLFGGSRRPGSVPTLVAGVSPPATLMGGVESYALSSGVLAWAATAAPPSGQAPVLEWLRVGIAADIGRAP
jgi:membrane-associated phospholipid phosphatase